jgi:hypothetical protein
VEGINNSLIIGVLNELLLQSTDQFISVFPKWKDGEASFYQLRANGSFLVSSKFSPDKGVEYIRIFSEKGLDCSVLNPWGNGMFTVYQDHKPIKTEKIFRNCGEVYRFATEENQTYLIINR